MGKIGVGSLKPDKVAKRKVRTKNQGLGLAGMMDKFGLRKGSALNKSFKK